MSREIDERIVQMRFDNEEFERRIAKTENSLSKLKEALRIDDVSNGYDNLAKAINGISFAGMVKDLAGPLTKFKLIDNAISSIIAKTEKMVKSVTIEPVSAGWTKYADITKSTQTIMAATAKDFEDEVKQMEVVNAQLAKLNWFTDETSFNLTDMTNNIGKFTSAGVDLETAATAMQGIGTWASISGQGAQEASRAMYNLAQSLGTGAVKLQDWMSIENANMATLEFKENVIQSAEELGTLTKIGDGLYQTINGSEVSAKNFRENLKEGWFTSEVLTKTLDKYGGFANKLNEYYEKTNLLTSDILDYVERYSKGSLDLEKEAKKTSVPVSLLTEMVTELSKAEYDLGRKAFAAAQEAKTFKEAIEATQDAVSSGWMNTFQLVFGDYKQAKKIWTALANELYDVFAAPGEFRNEVLEAWAGAVDEVSGLNGRQLWFGDLENEIPGVFGYIWSNIKAINGAINDAFGTVFKAFGDAELMGEKLFNFSKWLRDATAKLVLSEDTIEKIKNGAIGVFSVVKSLGHIIASVLEPFRKHFLDFIGYAIKIALPVVYDAIHLLRTVFTNASTSKRFTIVIDGINKSLTALTRLLKIIVKTVLGVVDIPIRVLDRINSSFYNTMKTTKSFGKSLVESLRMGVFTLTQGFGDLLADLTGIEKFRTIAKDLQKSFLDLTIRAEEFGKKVKDIYTNYGKGFPGAIQAILYVGGKAFKSITGWLSKVTGIKWFDSLGTNAFNNIQKIRVSFKDFTDRITSEYNSFGGGISGGLKTVVHEVGNLASKGLNWLADATGIEWFRTLVPLVSSFFDNMKEHVDGFIESVSIFFKPVTTAAGSLFDLLFGKEKKNLKDPLADVADSAEENAARAEVAYKSLSQMALEVIRGDWGNGVDRDNALWGAGYDNDRIQELVNKIWTLQGNFKEGYESILAEYENVDARMEGYILPVDNTKTNEILSAGKSVTNRIKKVGESAHMLVEEGITKPADKAHEGVTKTVKSIGDQLTDLRNRVLAQLPKIFASIGKGVANFAIWVAKARQNIVNFIETNHVIDKIGDFVFTTASVIVTVFRTAVKIGKKVYSVLKTIANVLWIIGTISWKAIQSGIDSLSKSFGNVGKAAKKLFKSLFGIETEESTETFKDNWNNLWKEVKISANTAIDSFVKKHPKLDKALKSINKTIKKIFPNFDATSENMSSFFGGIKTLGLGIGKSFRDHAPDFDSILASLMEGDWTKAKTSAKTAIKSVWEDVRTEFSNFIQNTSAEHPKFAKFVEIVTTIKDKFVGAFQSILGFFQRHAPEFATFAQTIGGFLGTGWETISSWFANTKNWLGETFEGVGPVLDDLISAILTFDWDTAKEILKGAFEILGTKINEACSSAIEIGASGVAKLATFVSGALGFIGKAFSGVLGESGEEIEKSLGTLGAAPTEIATTVSQMTADIQETGQIKPETLEQFTGVFENVSGVIGQAVGIYKNFKFASLAGSLVTMTKGASKSLEKLPDLMKSVTDTLNKTFSVDTVKSLIKLKNRAKTAETIKDIAVSFFLIVGAIAILGTLKEETLQQGLDAAWKVGLGLVAFFAAVKILNLIPGLSSGISGIFKGIGYTLIGFAAAVLVLVGAVWAFGEMSQNQNKLINGLSAVAALILALGVTIAIIIAVAGKASQKTGGAVIALKGIAAMVIGIGVAIGIITLSVFGMSKIKTGLVKGIAGVIVIMVAITGMISAIAAIATKSGGTLAIKAAGMILAVALAVLILVIPVKELAGMKWEDWAKGILGISILMAVLSVVISSIAASTSSSSWKDIFASILMVIEVVGALAGILWVLHEFPPSMSLTQAGALALVMGVLFGGTGLISFLTTLKGFDFSNVVNTALMLAETVGFLAGIMATMTEFPINFNILQITALKKLFESIYWLIAELAAVEMIDNGIFGKSKKEGLTGFMENLGNVVTEKLGSGGILAEIAGFLYVLMDTLHKYPINFTKKDAEAFGTLMSSIQLFVIELAGISLATNSVFDKINSDATGKRDNLQSLKDIGISTVNNVTILGEVLATVAAALAIFHDENLTLNAAWTNTSITGNNSALNTLDAILKMIAGYAGILGTVRVAENSILNVATGKRSNGTKALDTLNNTFAEVTVLGEVLGTIRLVLEMFSDEKLVVSDSWTEDKIAILTKILDSVTGFATALVAIGAVKDTILTAIPAITKTSSESKFSSIINSVGDVVSNIGALGTVIAALYGILWTLNQFQLPDNFDMESVGIIDALLVSFAGIAALLSTITVPEGGVIAAFKAGLTIDAFIAPILALFTIFAAIDGLLAEYDLDIGSLVRRILEPIVEYQQKMTDAADAMVDVLERTQDIDPEKAQPLLDLLTLFKEFHDSVDGWDVLLSIFSGGENSGWTLIGTAIGEYGASLKGFGENIQDIDDRKLNAIIPAFTTITDAIKEEQNIYQNDKLTEYLDKMATMFSALQEVDPEKLTGLSNFIGSLDTMIQTAMNVGDDIDADKIFGESFFNFVSIGIEAAAWKLTDSATLNTWRTAIESMSAEVGKMLTPDDGASKVGVIIGKFKSLATKGANAFRDQFKNGEGMPSKYASAAGYFSGGIVKELQSTSDGSAIGELYGEFSRLANRSALKFSNGFTNGSIIGPILNKAINQFKISIVNRLDGTTGSYNQEILDTFENLARDSIVTFSDKFSSISAVGHYNAAVNYLTTTVSALLVTSGNTMVATLASTIASGYNLIFHMARNAVQGVVDGVNSMYASVQSVGLNTMQGLINGMNTMAPAVNAAAHAIGSNIERNLRAPLAVYSPSRVATEIGEFVDIGLINGLMNKSEDVQNAASYVSIGVADVMDGIIQNATHAMEQDANPTITPVVDMSNVTRSAGFINSMFAGGTWGFSASANAARAARVGTMSVSAQQVTRDINYQDSLNAMREDIQGLSESIANMQIVMDSGALVGSIAAPMDRALGRRTVHAARRN